MADEKDEDDLLNDLDDLDNDSEEDDLNKDLEDSSSDEEMGEGEGGALSLNLGVVTNLRKSERYINHMNIARVHIDAMKAAEGGSGSDGVVMGEGREPVSATVREGEYKFIMDTNKLLVDMTDEIINVHKLVVSSSSHLLLSINY
jgi:hypothetical protein